MHIQVCLRRIVHFGPTSKSNVIEFELPEPSWVTLKVFNILVQVVASLLDRQSMDDGLQEIQFDGSSLSSGVYFYRLQSDSLIVDEDGDAVTGQTHTRVKKMLLIK